MSMYSMLFGMNRFAPIYLAVLGLKPEDVGRFRDCFLLHHDKHGLCIAVFTRNGGGNRSDYEATTTMLRAHPEFVVDFDDDFDCTYATYVFKVPETYRLYIEEFEKEPQQMVDPAQRFKDLLKKMEEPANKNDPLVQQALKVGEEILKPLLERMMKK